MRKFCTKLVTWYALICRERTTHSIHLQWRAWIGISTLPFLWIGASALTHSWAELLGYCLYWPALSIAWCLECYNIWINLSNRKFTSDGKPYLMSQMPMYYSVLSFAVLISTGVLTGFEQYIAVASIMLSGMVIYSGIFAVFDIFTTMMLEQADYKIRARVWKPLTKGVTGLSPAIGLGTIENVCPIFETCFDPLLDMPAFSWYLYHSNGKTKFIQTPDLYDLYIIDGNYSRYYKKHAPPEGYLTPDAQNLVFTLYDEFQNYISEANNPFTTDEKLINIIYSAYKLVEQLSTNDKYWRNFDFVSYEHINVAKLLLHHACVKHGTVRRL